jgi:hypothetical protein
LKFVANHIGLGLIMNNKLDHTIYSKKNVNCSLKPPPQQQQSEQHKPQTKLISVEKLRQIYMACESENEYKLLYNITNNIYPDRILEFDTAKPASYSVYEWISHIEQCKYCNRSAPIFQPIFIYAKKKICNCCMNKIFFI